MADRESWQDKSQVVLTRPDWWSRLMSFGAMLLAAAALLNSMGIVPPFFPQRTAVDGTDAAARTALKPVDDAFSDRASAPPAAVQDELEDPDVDIQLPGEDAADRSVADRAADGSPTTDAGDGTGRGLERDAMEADGSQVDELFDDALATQTAGADPTREERPIAEPEDDALLDLEGLEQNPQLQIVHTALRPTDERPTAVVTVKNTGTAPAVITDAIFMPTSVVELPREVSLGEVGQTDASNLVIAFTSDDNQATESGKHADYGRRLQSEFSVAPGESVRVHVVIQDQEFVGYGFEGDLRLIFNAIEKLEVSGVTLAFVP